MQTKQILAIIATNAFSLSAAFVPPKYTGLSTEIVARRKASEVDEDAVGRRGFFKKALGGAALAGIVGNKIAIEGPDPFAPAVGSMNGKVVVITGGNTGLGLESATRLAKGGATIVLTSRNPIKGANAVQAVKDAVPGSEVYTLPLDLCDFQSVKAFPNLFKESPIGDRKVDVLMNNAGVMAIPEYKETKDGFEKTFQSNHLGHFVLTSGMFPLLNKGARVVNVSSMAHLIVADGLDIDNLNAEKEYKPWDAYGRSKMENILFTKELQRRVDEAGIDVTAVTLHPGAVRTDLARYIIGEDKFVSMNSKEKPKLDPVAIATLPFGVYFTKAVDRGASSQIWLSSFQGDNVGGKFFQNMKEVKLGPGACDMDKAKQLWEISEKLSGVQFNL